MKCTSGKLLLFTGSCRSPPPPNLPGGEAHKLAFNYYYTRDGRRDVQPPTVLSSSKLVADKSDIEVE